MQDAQLSQKEVDRSPLEQDDGVQLTDAGSSRTAALLAMVPNLTVLAAGFFATIPIQSPDAMGGVH
jgi:hypothetical protein